jgi:hypothetical protein
LDAFAGETLFCCSGTDGISENGDNEGFVE